MDEDLDYLQPNFDPTTFRVADLRRVLLFHGVGYTSSAKKADLVTLFLENITPNAETILEEKSGVVPSCQGIEFEDDLTRQVLPLMNPSKA